MKQNTAVNSGTIEILRRYALDVAKVFNAQEAFERLPPSFVLYHEYDYSEDTWGAMWLASPEVPDTKIVAEGADFVVRHTRPTQPAPPTDQHTGANT